MKRPEELTFEELLSTIESKGEYWKEVSLREDTSPLLLEAVSMLSLLNGQPDTKKILHFKELLVAQGLFGLLDEVKKLLIMDKKKKKFSIISNINLEHIIEADDEGEALDIHAEVELPKEYVLGSWELEKMEEIKN